MRADALLAAVLRGCGKEGSLSFHMGRHDIHQDIFEVTYADVF